MHVHVHHLAYELEGSACQRQLPQTSLPQQLVARHPLRIQRILLMPCSCLVRYVLRTAGCLQLHERTIDLQPMCKEYMPVQGWPTYAGLKC